MEARLAQVPSVLIANAPPRQEELVRGAIF